jgi:hypothetical protein
VATALFDFEVWSLVNTPYFETPRPGRVAILNLITWLWNESVRRQLSWRRDVNMNLFLTLPFLKRNETRFGSIQKKFRVTDNSASIVLPINCDSQYGPINTASLFKTEEKTNYHRTPAIQPVKKPNLKLYGVWFRVIRLTVAAKHVESGVWDLRRQFYRRYWRYAAAAVAVRRRCQESHNSKAWIYTERNSMRI